MPGMLALWPLTLRKIDLYILVVTRASVDEKAWGGLSDLLYLYHFSNKHNS